MCYVDVIGVNYLVLICIFVVAVNTDICIINLTLYIFFWSLREINVLFWWGDPVVPVSEEKGLNHV